jgi:hypothetical protein
MGCNGPTRIRSADDVVLTAVYDLAGWEDEQLNLLFEKWRGIYLKYGNPAADGLHILEQVSRLHGEETRLKRALAEVRETKKTLHLKSGQTRSKLRRAAKCYDRLTTDEQDAIVTKKLIAQLEES